MPPTLRGLHHAQITIPVGAEAVGRAFYAELLGLAELPKPEPLIRRGGFWLQVGAQQLHVGLQDGVERHGSRAHVALEVDDLDALRARLGAAGIETLDGEPVPGLRRCECRDPFGNRLEFVQVVG